jgi:hypothetical protein
VIWQLPILPSVTRVLALHARRVSALLGDPGVVDHPGQNAELGGDPLRASAHEQLRIPRRIGEKLLHRLVPGWRLLKPEQGRLQALPATLLNQPTHVHERVLTLPHMRQRRHHRANEIGQTLPRLRRRHLNRDRCSHHCPPKR